jgi:hypothetical protein
MIRDDDATQEAIELYLLVDANGPVMPTIARIADRLRSLTQSPPPDGSARRLAPPDDSPSAKRRREGLYHVIAESV